MEIYIFGSALWKEEPGDLDILLVYNKQTEITSKKEKLPQTVAGKPIHLTCLTEEEMAESHVFLDNVKKTGVCIYNKNGWKI